MVRIGSEGSEKEETRQHTHVRQLGAAVEVGGFEVSPAAAVVAGQLHVGGQLQAVHPRRRDAPGPRRERRRVVRHPARADLARTKPT
jgi:hypothetical protein